jgi:hypothetical protein
MILTDSSESKVNWTLKLGSPPMRQRMIKSVANLLFLRGDGVYDLNAESLFADEEVYARNQPCNF